MHLLIANWQPASHERWHINVQAMAWQGMWAPLKWSTHHGSFVVSTQKKPPILQLTDPQMPIYSEA